MEKSDCALLRKLGELSSDSGDENLCSDWGGRPQSNTECFGSEHDDLC